MKSEVIVVSSKGKGMDTALAQADKFAEQMGLSHRESLQMRLLVEEVMSMMRSIIGQLEGKFWIEMDNSEYKLYLQSRTLMDSEQRAMLLSASSSGKNEAHRGIMGKLRAFFEPMPFDNSPAYLAGTVLPGNEKGDLNWSLEAYRERLEKRKDASEEAQDAWDELEKSVVTHIADNVVISIRGYDVELMISKKLG
ncbi:MAG: hypothetical protein IJT77_06840 [Clostridia bacterium]|nr:hypothetical protein [Clostridia bacterium]